MQTNANVTNKEGESRRQWKKSVLSKIWKLRCNFVYTMIVTALVCVGYAAPFSTLHQFITYPRANGSEPAQTAGSFGLGESEIVYAWVIAMYSVGETVAALGTGLMLRYFSYWSCLMFSVFLHLVGGVLYGVATNGAMMLMSRLLIGAHAGLGWSLVVAYYGERCEEYDQLKLKIRQEKASGKLDGDDEDEAGGRDGKEKPDTAMELVSDEKTKTEGQSGAEVDHRPMKCGETQVVKTVKHGTRTKDLLHSIFSISNSLMSGVGVVLVIILQFIPGVDKFRIVGWLNAILAAFVMILQFVMFRGEGYCNSENWKVGRLLHSHHLPWKQIKCHQSGIKIVFLCVLVMVFYTIDSGYNVIDTLSNPILSNQFAFTVEDAGYFFAVATFGFAIGTVILPGLHRCRIDNRYIWIGGVSLALAGTIILADWQSIGFDPCGDPTFNFSSSICENLTFPGDTCFWRQMSRVTGKMCLECPLGCASDEKSLNFVQFCVAFLLWVVAVPVVRTVSFIITSDQVGKNEQGTVLGICIAAGGLSRVITPLWLNSLYVSTGQHTWLPMIILLVNLIVIIISFLLFCEKTKRHCQSVHLARSRYNRLTVQGHTEMELSSSVS